jgi:hypothetical protein
MRILVNESPVLTLAFDLKAKILLVNLKQKLFLLFDPFKNYPKIEVSSYTFKQQYNPEQKYQLEQNNLKI